MDPRPDSESVLSPAQLQALFEILTHHECFSEVHGFKHSHSFTEFGFPLQPRPIGDSSSPLIQCLLKRFVLSLPGLRGIDIEFWSCNILDLAVALTEANLSESFDKGSIGIRKVFCTAISALAEPVCRGTLGGLPHNDENPSGQYDISNPNDIENAWQTFLRHSVNGQLIDRLFAKTAETDKLEEHDSLTQAAHEYVIIMLSSFVQFTLVVSPRGQTILSLHRRVNDLLPYFLIRQTLKIGNAASMINGMIKVVLAKMNLSTFTSWIGGQPSDSGTNLLQYIISSVLNWDISALRKRANILERKGDLGSKLELDVIQDFCQRPATEQHEIRQQCQREQYSIIKSIFSDHPDAAQLSEEEHAYALEYLATQLAVSDRQKLIEVLCCHRPDLLTASVRFLIEAYVPIIRDLHKAVNLSETIYDLQNFLSELISLATLDRSSKEDNLPTVEDFYLLLRKHAESSHKFLHQMLKNSPELMHMYQGYAHSALSQYKCENTQSCNGRGAGNFTGILQNLFAEILPADQAKVREELDECVQYLSSLKKESSDRLSVVVKHLATRKSGTLLGPGIWLAKWQELIDRTVVTSLSSNGPVRTGKTESVRQATAIDVDGHKKGFQATQAAFEGTTRARPLCSETTRLLLPRFKQAIGGLEA